MWHSHREISKELKKVSKKLGAYVAPPRLVPLDRVQPVGVTRPNVLGGFFQMDHECLTEHVWHTGSSVSETDWHEMFDVFVSDWTTGETAYLGSWDAYTAPLRYYPPSAGLHVTHWSHIIDDPDYLHSKNTVTVIFKEGKRLGGVSFPSAIHYIYLEG